MRINERQMRRPERLPDIAGIANNRVPHADGKRKRVLHGVQAAGAMHTVKNSLSFPMRMESENEFFTVCIAPAACCALMVTKALAAHKASRGSFSAISQERLRCGRVPHSSPLDRREGS